MKKFTIYKITNLINDKIYIGQTSRPIKKRLSAHINSANHGSGYAIHKAIRKYGSENFDIQEIDFAESKEEMNEKERFYVTEHKSNDPRVGYNMTVGGDGYTGTFFQTEETKKQISETMTGMKRPRSVCPHCGVEGSSNHLKRWHNDHCPKLTGKKHKLKPLEKITCPHCSKTGGSSNMKSFHFDNCLSNPNLTKEQVETLKEQRSRRRKGSVTK
jgi:group I intron endonuclease